MGVKRDAPGFAILYRSSLGSEQDSPNAILLLDIFGANVCNLIDARPEIRTKPRHPTLRKGPFRRPSRSGFPEGGSQNQIRFVITKPFGSKLDSTRDANPAPTRRDLIQR